MRALDQMLSLTARSVQNVLRQSPIQFRQRYHILFGNRLKMLTTITDNRTSEERAQSSSDDELQDNHKKIVFNDTENQFAFGIIDSLLSKYKFELNEKQMNGGPDCDPILNKFFEIDPRQFENSKYHIEDLIRVLKFLSLKQISKVLQSLIQWSVSSPFNGIYFRIWSKIDQELENRLKNINFINTSDVLEYLHIGNQFYRLRIANITKFNDNLIKKLCSPDYPLDKLTLLHLMFYANLQRSLDPKSVPFLMKKLPTLLQELSLEEIAVVAMSSFKTRTVWTEDLTRLLIVKACVSMSSETTNIVRTEITKCIRKSAGDYYYKVQPEVRQYIHTIKRLPDNSSVTLAHLLNLMTSTHVCDQDLMATAVDRVNTNLKEFRIKDIERIFMCLSFFNNDNHMKTLVSICDKLHSNRDTLNIFSYPNCLLNILHYLCVLKCYPKFLIENCFDPPFLKKIQIYSKLDFQRHLLLTNTALSVEKYDEFKDILLSPELVYRYHRWILSEEKIYNRISRRHSMINSVYMTLLSLLGKRVQLCHIIPSKSHPFIVIFDDPKKNFSFGPTTQLKANMFKDCVVVFIVELNDYAIEEIMLKGSVNLEIRLLEGLGFQVVIVSWSQFMRFNTYKGRRNVITKEILKSIPQFRFNKIN